VARLRYFHTFCSVFVNFSYFETSWPPYCVSLWLALLAKRQSAADNVVACGTEAVRCERSTKRSRNKNTTKIARYLLVNIIEVLLRISERWVYDDQARTRTHCLWCIICREDDDNWLVADAADAVCFARCVRKQSPSELRLQSTTPTRLRFRESGNASTK